MLALMLALMLGLMLLLFQALSTRILKLVLVLLMNTCSLASALAIVIFCSDICHPRLSMTLNLPSWHFAADLCMQHDIAKTLC
jgi:hypothetical protein